MATWSLNTGMQVEITARLIAKGDDLPLQGDDYAVRLFDRDFFEDEYIGECKPDSEGRVYFVVPGGTFKHNPMDDNRPDFFFAVFKSGTVIFVSKVMENVYLEGIEEYRKGEGLVVDLGTFLIDINNT